MKEKNEKDKKETVEEKEESSCSCGCSCECEDEECTCEEDSCTCESKANEYLEMARRIQADFENFRRKSAEGIENARLDGQISIIETFLPCLDTFETAKCMITDEKVLEGVNMIENKIRSNLASLGVEEIESIGEKYDPRKHNVVAVMCDNEKENDIILKQFQAGYTFKGKVIRYSKVIVNKRED